MDRLRNAVDRMPGGTQRPAAVPQPSEAAVAEERAPRFGINSLISKMTGAAETQPERAEQPAAPRAQPAVQRTQAAPAPEPEIEEAQDQDRIEIPAFLRRQAN
jgi:cell division protein FtsZ